jgi:hypothetical protein
MTATADCTAVGWNTDLVTTTIGSLTATGPGDAR